jgi:hypothetical protein
VTAIAQRRRTIVRLGSAGALLAAAFAGMWTFQGDPAAASRIDPASVDLAPLTQIPDHVWDTLAGKRILFGHQSVGDDIVAGLQDIMTQVPRIKLRLVESRDPEAFDSPGFIHFKVGANENSGSKLDDFSAVIKSPLGQRADFAMMKFCYVDLFASGDPRTMFQAYKSALDTLSAAAPGPRFIHITVPLTTVETGPKARIKRLIGKTLWGHADNVQRHVFNTSIRTEYGPAVFDLAVSESTLPNGTRSQFTSAGARFECLSKGYTDDGGHLNQAGRRAAARDLLLLLANQCK